MSWRSSSPSRRAPDADVPEATRLRRLHDALAALHGELDISRVADAIVRTAVDSPGVDAAALMLAEEGSDELRIVAQRGLSERYAAEQRIPLAGARASYPDLTEPAILELPGEAKGDRALVEAEGLARVLAVPVIHAGAFVGSLNLYVKQGGRAPDAEEVELARVLAVHAATALATARLFAEAVGARERQEALLREREEFVSVVSHELKTPLTPLKAFAQLLRTRARRAREQGQPLDLPALEKGLLTVERQVDRMNRLVNDLLEVSRAGRGRFELVTRRFDLAVAVRELVQRYREVAAAEGPHRFEDEAPETLPFEGDQTRIEQMLMDLLDNATKYSPEGGLVRVVLREEPGAIELSVSDEGIGIGAEDLARIGREPFVRGTGRAATFAGLGVGLHVCRLVAEGHGGALSIESPGEDRGTTVRVRLPPR